MRRLFLLLLFLALLRLVQLPHIPNSAIGGYDIAENEAATSVPESTSSSPHPSLDATDTTFEGAARYQAHPPSSTSHLDTLTDFTSVATPSSNVSSTNILPVAGSSGVSATTSSVLLEGTAPASIPKHIASLGNNVIIFTVIAFAVVVEVFWVFRKSLPESWKTGFWKYVGRIYARIIPKPVIYTTMPAFENQFKSRDLFIYGFFYGMNGLAIFLPLCATAVDHKNWQTISVSISMMLIQLGLMADKLRSLRITLEYDSRLKRSLASFTSKHYHRQLLEVRFVESYLFCIKDTFVQSKATSSSDMTGNQGIVDKVDPDSKGKFRAKTAVVHVNIRYEYGENHAAAHFLRLATETPEGQPSSP